MKKDIKLYNVFFPTYILFAFNPVLWIISIFGKYIIDSTLLLILSLIIFKKYDKKFLKCTFKKVYLYGFLADIIGVFYLIAIYFIYEFAICSIITDSSMTNSQYKILVTIYYISGIVVAGFFIFLFDYRYSFSYTDPRELTKKERIFSSLYFAILTAPYTHLIPSTLMYELPFII